jgi:hypothetical protein
MTDGSEAELVKELIWRNLCVVCGKPASCITGYAYFEDGSEISGVPWCEEHERLLGMYANPVFESLKALERFKKEHPRLYKRGVEGREVIFLTKKPRHSSEVLGKIRKWRDEANAERLREKDYARRQRLLGQVIAFNRVLDLLEGSSAGEP